MTSHAPESENRLDPEQTPHWPPAHSLSGADVRSAFDRETTLTVGLEEELMLLDPGSYALAPAIDRALALTGGDRRFARELRQSQVEIMTPVAGNATAAGLNLARGRLDLAEALAGELLIAAAGVHPCCDEPGGLAEGDRYEKIAREYSWPLRGTIPCGLHVHVAVPGADRALAVFNASRSYLPEIAALAANSPFLDGVDTGLASARATLNDALHRARIPPHFASWDDLAKFVTWGSRGGLFPDATHLWWSLRPHLRFGTLELRVADAQTRVEDALAVAAVFQALVASLILRHDGGELLPVHDEHRIAENTWRATRYGVRGWMVDLDSGEPQTARDRIVRMLDEIEPCADALGSSMGLLTARALVADNGAERQRYVEAADGVEGLVRWIATETVRSANDVLSIRA